MAARPRFRVKRRERRPSKAALVVYDIEAYDWENIICIVAMDLRTGEEYVFANIKDFAEWVTGLGDVILFAHYGGGYDHLHLQNVLPKCAEVIQVGSRTLSSKFTKKEAGFRLVLRDTWPWVQASLEKLGEAIGIPKIGNTQAPLKTGRCVKLDVSRLERYEPSAVVEYCRRDVQILAAVIKKILGWLEQQKAQVRWTAGGVAVEMLRVLEPDTWEKLCAARLTVDDVEKLHDAKIKVGGRVECFYYGQTKKKIYLYDIHSSYPKSLIEAPLPIGATWTCAEEYQAELTAIVRCKWERVSDKPPAYVLGRFNRGTGKCSRWLPIDEYQFLLTDPDAINVEILETIYCDEWLPMGKIFVEKLMAEKEAGYPWAKVFLNSFPGKTLQRPISDIYIGDGEQYFSEETILSVKTAGKSIKELEQIRQRNCPPHMQPLIGVTVMGRARIRLTQVGLAVIKAGFHWYYCDTDCIPTDAPPEKFAEICESVGQRMGPHVGEWGIDAEGLAAFAGKKLYHVGKKVRIKGVPKEYQSSALVKRLAGGKSEKVEFRRFSQFLSSIRHGARAGTVSRHRTLQRTHLGKVIDLSGWTRYI